MQQAEQAVGRGIGLHKIDKRCGGCSAGSGNAEVELGL